MWQTQKQTDTGHGTYQTWNWVTFCDPATQRPGNPATRWPCSIMNSKCRLMCRGVRIIDVAKKYSQAKEFLIITGNSKSLLHRLTSSDFSLATTDTRQWLLSFQHFKCTFCIFSIFRKPEKLGSHTGSKWWPGDPNVWKMTHWPGDPMTQFHVWHMPHWHSVAR